jgi:hypothetical protein
MRKEGAAVRSGDGNVEKTGNRETREQGGKGTREAGTGKIALSSQLPALGSRVVALQTYFARLTREFMTRKGEIFRISELFG